MQEELLVGDLARLGSASVGLDAGRRRPSLLLTLAGAVLSCLALSLGAVVALVFAATLACVLILATLLLGLAALTVRSPRRLATQGAFPTFGLPAHAWIAYQWDRPKA
jgi:hypothetical protein